ncbi:acyltransferase family protein [Paenibacillus sp. CAU 1782]
MGLNGSMWTLKHEIACYLALIFFSFFHLLKHRTLYLMSTVLMGLISVYSLVTNTLVVQLPGPKFWVLGEYEFLNFSKFLFLYMMGSLFYVYKDKIRINSRLYLLSILILIFSTKLNQLHIALLILLPYIVLSTCFVLKKLAFFSKFGDYSYGLYFFSFPIQQLLVFYFDDYLNIKTFFIFSVILTLGVSILSWRYIESPSLKLGKWIITKEYHGKRGHHNPAS